MKEAGHADQCHSIYNYDSACGGNVYNCANKDLAVSWTLNVISRLVSSCAEGYEIKNNRCILKTTTIPNCETVNDNSGVCQGCKAGFILIDESDTSGDALVTGISFDRSKLFSYRCFDSITNCIEYNY